MVVLVVLAQEVQAPAGLLLVLPEEAAAVPVGVELMELLAETPGVVEDMVVLA